MTLADMLEAVSQCGTVPLSRVKDLKTSVRYLTQAAATIPGMMTDAESLESRYKTLLRSYFASLHPLPSPHTVRNTLNNLSLLYRVARTHGLISSIPPRPTKRTRVQAAREMKLTSPYRDRTRLVHMHYQLPVTAWPATIREPWIAYQNRRELMVRPITLWSYEQRLTPYISFGLKVDDPPLTTWDELFDVQRLTRFIKWHRQRANVSRISERALLVVKLIIRLARDSQRPECTTLQAFKKQLPKPEPMHNKQHPDHCISLRELEQVGLSLLSQARNPLQSPGQRKVMSLHRACRHRTGLMLRLLVRVPMRIRNLCEMQLGQNLYKDHSGTWQLRFQGEELKISERGGRTNVFHLPFPPDLVEHLEEYLEQYRPGLTRSAEKKHVFLTHLGRAFIPKWAGEEFRDQVYFHTDGKRFYPHLIRTIWTDTCLLQTHDISTVAFMLNDRPETVLQRYHELRANDHIQKAYQFTQSLLGS